MLIKILPAAALIAGLATAAHAADPVTFVGQAVVTVAPATDCPDVGTVVDVTYRIAFGDRPDSIYISFPWGSGRELRPKGRTTFAAKGTATFGEANGYGFWSGDVSYSGFAVTPSTGVANANTVRLTITHAEPNKACKITLVGGLAREG